MHAFPFPSPSRSSSSYPRHLPDSGGLSLLQLLVRRSNGRFRKCSNRHHHRRRSSHRQSGVSVKAMPCSSIGATTIGRGGGDDNGSLRNFKLNESTFLASLMPKKEIAADLFIEEHPEYDGRGVVIAIFDSGVDPAAAGLQFTSDGKPKILDVLDCTGSGDVDTSKVVQADLDGLIYGASGASLAINSSWKNPSGNWHVGCKLVYELFTDSLTSRLKKERRKKWDEKNQEAIAKAVIAQDEFDQEHGKAEDADSKRIKEDLENRVDLLRKQAESYEDHGPIIDAVVWHDGEVWRVALDTQSLENGSDSGKLADFEPLTNFRIERKYGIFSKLDACTFVVNVYDYGKTLSIVTDCSPHGTHVAGIATAFHSEEPLLNGIAPGAQIISCKIGDSRLGSMETGTGLTRALIAAVEHKCDLINMSYGEPTLFPDYGRFVDLVNEVVDMHRLIFVSSAGNNGPALSTVGAPGGTSSSIIGVGAYLSPAMAAGTHCVVEAPSEGLEYTWSSRGPTFDGDVGVSISAPGGAVAPVPTWTLQRRMLMNGTSMASPSACGGVALLLSAMKAEGIYVSPYSVRRALENTCVPVGGLPEDKLSAGQGLIQVNKAFEYIKMSKNVPNVQYQVKVTQSGTSAPTFRGIYLREATSCEHSTEWTIQVEPKFHEDAGKLEELVPFEECIELYSTEKAIVRPPEFLLLTHNGRSFNIVVDPCNLGTGLHYFEVYGIDCKSPWRGPLFRIPITVTKPAEVAAKPPAVSFSKMSFVPGHIERRFIKVPRGVTWVEATMRTSEFDTTRRFFVDAVQICPLQRPVVWESVVTFSSPAAKSYAFPVIGGQTMELVIAQFWSSGIGSNVTAAVDFEIAFHGIDVKKEELILDGSEAPLRIAVEALLASENLSPAAVLNKVRIAYRPVDSKLCALASTRDMLPSGKQILALTLTYKFKLEDGSEIRPYVPLLNNRVYDTKFESQFYMVSDSNKRVHTMGDVYPKFTKLPKGEYTLQLYLRHENVQYLEKLKQLVLFIERKLEEKDAILLSFFSQPDGPVTGDGAYKSSVLIPGKKEAIYLAPPTKEKLPKNAPSGSVLVGTISYGKLSTSGQDVEKNPQKNPASYQISYVIPPNKAEEEKGKLSSSIGSKSTAERLDKVIRDAKIKFFGSLKQSSDEERSEWKNLSIQLKSDYPKYTPLLAKILEGLLSQSNASDKISHNQEAILAVRFTLLSNLKIDNLKQFVLHYEMEQTRSCWKCIKIIDAVDDVIDSIDKEELANYFAFRSDPEDEDAERIKKKMETTRDQLVEALYRKGLAIAEIESVVLEKASAAGDDEPGEGPCLPSGLFEENLKELKKWVDVKSSKHGTLLVLSEKRHGRLGTALKVLNDMIQEDGDPPKKQLYELKLSLLGDIGWDHLHSYEKEWMHVRFPVVVPLF